MRTRSNPCEVILEGVINMDCYNSESCVNKEIKCLECRDMADIYGYHPYYSQGRADNNLRMVKKVKVIEAYDTSLLETDINEFIKDKNIIDIQYRPFGIACYPYERERAMIIYMEEV